jgi:iron complex transport system ATP-binding protein
MLASVRERRHMRFEVRDLVVRYPGAIRPALDGISMTVPDGCFYAVLGPNGSGKSTLVRSMMGVIHPAAGTTSIDEREVSTWDRRELARAVGAVSQSETLSFPLTVREMVAMGRYPHLGPLSGESDADKEAVAAALAECDITEFASRDVSTLSGGERQRVRIARALAQQPRALVLDEPTNSLDIGHEMAILELLRRSADSGLTVVVVTHGLDLAARFADRLLLLSQGSVASEGTPAEVLTEPTLAGVYGWPVSVSTDPASGTPRVTPLRQGQV